MGMFDYVHFEMDCPKCGAPIRGFQSKDFDCEMENIEPDALMRFYGSCGKCMSWIEFYKPRLESPPLREKSLTLAEVAEMGFVMSVSPL